MIEITSDPIDPQPLLAAVASDRCGANLLFTGTTRRITGERETAQLEYECYREMAVATLRELCETAKQKWPLHEVAVVHRIGVVPVGEISIAVAVSSPHRAAAFAAGGWLLEELKRSVPIWKKENWVDGTSEWVHPGLAHDPAPRPSGTP